MSKRIALALTRIAALGLIAALVLIAALAGCGRGASVPADLPLRAVGPYRVGVATSPSTPRTGENALTVVVQDPGGAPVRGAAIDAVISMPAMGAMPYMESRGKVREVAPGVYRAEYGLAMAGEWDAAIRIRPPRGEAVEVTGRLSTHLDGFAADAGADADAGDSAVTRTAAGADSGAPATITLDATRRQSLGIKVEPVAMRELTVDIRAAGRVAYDETRLAEVSLKYSGWVRAVRADFTGQAVRRGDVLFDSYSPDLWAAQQEFLTALQAAREDSASGAGGGADLLAASRTRLALWDLSAADIDAIARAGKPRETLPVRAPAGGVVTEKDIVLGSPFQAGQVLYKIARTDPVWVLAAVYERDLPLVHAGMPARIGGPAAGGRVLQGRVAFVAPDLAPDTRTGTVRIELPNPREALKPGMFVDVTLRAALGNRLAIPESAVLPTGERRVVFVDRGAGRLEPRDVTLGARAGEWYEVVSGLAAGDRVVTSGNFLVAAESRLRSATGKW